MKATCPPVPYTNVRPITYRQLAEAIEKMADEQKDCHVTVEDGTQDECFPASLRIAGADHGSLDEGHPVIYYTQD